ncbi:MAG: SdiA-regulated domain-containing protein, partial [Bacteroidota bacterium]
MSLLEKPNLLSLLILGFVVLVAGGYGVVTYTQRPEMEHYAVDPEYGFGFDFDRPDRVVTLPKDLQEVSGLAPWRGEDEVLAIQDEDGEIFVVNANSGNVTENFKFGKDRDYEGIARLYDSLYVLERDGDVHQVTYREGVDELDSKKLETDFIYRNDTEGICYDPATGHLLIVPKEQELNPQVGDDARRGIYAFDLTTRELTPQPAFFVDEYAIGNAVYGTRKRYNIKPSGVAVDPVTEHIYLLASVGKIMVVIDRESEIKHIELLREKVFGQPEGITFNASGDLYISSEGKGGQAILAVYRRQNSEQE